MAAGACGEGAGVLVGWAELGAVAVGLLVVVAEDLVVLGDAVADELFEPVGEAFVQVGADFFGGGEVGGLADEDVFEAVGGPTGDQACGCEADQVFACEEPEFVADCWA